jgi:hypothetical protein
MYRFSIDGREWILRFSQHLEIEEKEKESIIQSVMTGPKLKSFSHGDSFLLFDEELGVIVFKIEKVPSSILTVSTIVPKENWFNKNGASVVPYHE